MSLDDKRTELLPAEKLGPIPTVALTPADHAKNNLPDLLARWNSLRVGRVIPNAPSGSTNAPGTRSTHAGGLGITRPTPDLIAAEDPAPYDSELTRPRTAQSFCVPKADLVAQNYDLSLNRYKEVVHAEVAHRPPAEILQALGKLEAEIQQGMKELEGMLK
jgi:type I restriction enzyme M protein